MANKGLNNKQRLENQFKNARGNLLLVGGCAYGNKYSASCY